MTDTSHYAAAGVNIEEGDAFVEAIAPHTQATDRSGSIKNGGVGGFAALFDLKAAGFTDPVLAAATDGVGTKLAVADLANMHEFIGQDLVAMCVNDLICTGAEPLFFLDYFATGRLNLDTAQQVVAGIARACKATGCALVGGETAEMPGLYSGESYDLAGFAIGAYERGKGLDGKGIKTGDKVLAIASDGAHSNGYSLIRKIVADTHTSWMAPPPYTSNKESLAADLLTPTRLYPPALLKPIRTCNIKALAHITGGGISGNLCRILPDGLGAKIDAQCWNIQPLFKWLQATGHIPPHEMVRTFNCGIGMMAVTAPERVEIVSKMLKSSNLSVTHVGEIVTSDAQGPQKVHINNLDTAFE